MEFLLIRTGLGYREGETLAVSRPDGLGLSPIGRGRG
jgi:hypothetical protein